MPIDPNALRFRLLDAESRTFEVMRSDGLRLPDIDLETLTRLVYGEITVADVAAWWTLEEEPD